MNPIKDSEEARSEAIRKGLQEWYASTAYTRLTPNGAVVIIQTRWHEDPVLREARGATPRAYSPCAAGAHDLAGWLSREHKEENWDVFSMPAIAETDDGFRKAGEALWPERFPAQLLSEIRLAVGSAVWAALYQQKPAAATGQVFKREWWQYYRALPEFKRVCQSWDTAFKRGSENDYSVCTTWGIGQNGYFLLDLWRSREEFPELKRQVIALGARWKPSEILIEDKASGQSLLQELQRDTALAIRPIKVDVDKLARAQAATPTIEAKRVFLPESAPWLAQFVDEHAAFPNAAFDDQVDSSTQFLNHVRGAASGFES
jgi:predicted phage terminase large subunit-like protein